MLDFINPEMFIEMNKQAGENGICNRPELLASALSAWRYYDSPKDKVSSVFRGIVKNHAFFDGNKRTGVLALVTIAEKIGLPVVPDDELYFAVIRIADGNYSVDDISATVFK